MENNSYERRVYESLDDKSLYKVRLDWDRLG